MSEKKKILFMEWDSFGKEQIIRAWENLGFCVDRFRLKRESEDMRNNPALTESIVKKIFSDHDELVFSSNYFPVVAIACQACRVPYIAWIYDSPFVQLYSNTVFYDTNYIFHFDSTECELLQHAGVPHVYYMPMAVDPEYMVQHNFETLPVEKQNFYCADVSFVGSLYTENKQRFYDCFSKMDGYHQGYMEGVLRAQWQVYGYNFLQDSITPSLLKELQKVAPLQVNGDGFETIEWTYANYFMARKLTSMERTETIQELSREFDVKIFTYADTKAFPEIMNLGGLPYEDCPYAFQGAKINLNISLRSIQSGIPLRAMDIMGSGGFLLSNYQSDFLESFEPGQDFVYYESLADLKEKIRYYLTHEEERCQIAKNGCRKVRTSHTIQQRIKEMWEYVSGQTVSDVCDR
ncbi:MAG: DUF3880 domain-containing protein [Lachnospiraceae bacterium]|nr:DUF3880 domain-containing protein [Lachnospiraceae bacterium]